MKTNWGHRCKIEHIQGLKTHAADRAKSSYCGESAQLLGPLCLLQCLSIQALNVHLSPLLVLLSMEDWAIINVSRQHVHIVSSLINLKESDENLFRHTNMKNDLECTSFYKFKYFARCMSVSCINSAVALISTFLS